MTAPGPDPDPTPDLAALLREQVRKIVSRAHGHGWMASQNYPDDDERQEAEVVADVTDLLAVLAPHVAAQVAERDAEIERLRQEVDRWHDAFRHTEANEERLTARVAERDADRSWADRPLGPHWTGADVQTASGDPLSTLAAAHRYAGYVPHLRRALAVECIAHDRTRAERDAARRDALTEAAAELREQMPHDHLYNAAFHFAVKWLRHRAEVSP